MALGILFSFLTGCSKEVPIGEVERFSLNYNKGNMSGSRVSYLFENNEGEYTVSIKPYGEDEENVYTFKTDEDFADALEDILRKSEVGKWNGFDKVNKKVLDGNGFSLNIVFTDSSRIEASGYMKYPDGYGSFREAVDGLFGEFLQDQINFYYHFY